MRFAALVFTAGIAVSSAPIAAETASYQYDALGRLTASTLVHGTSASTTIGYDAAGNRTTYQVSFSSGTAAFAIGNASGAPGQTLTFTVTKSGTAAGTTTVNFTTASGSAVSGTDYTASLGTLSFAIGDTSKPINISTVSASAGNKTFTVVLSAPTGGATISTGTGTGTITAGANPEVTATSPSININSNTAISLALASLATLNAHAATIASMSPGSGAGSALIVTGGQSVTYTAPVEPTASYCNGATTTTVSVPYTIRDSDTGVVVSGTLIAYVTSPVGPPPKNPCP